MPVWGVHTAIVLPIDPSCVLTSSSGGHNIWKVELETDVQDRSAPGSITMAEAANTVK